MYIKVLLIGLLTIQKSIDGADLCLVIIICFDGIVAIETFYVGDLVMNFHIAAEVSRYRFKLIVRIGRVNIE